MAGAKQSRKAAGSKAVQAAVRETKRKASVRKITKTGTYTYYVTIPVEEIKALRWRKGQKVVVKRSGKKIVIEDWE